MISFNHPITAINSTFLSCQEPQPEVQLLRTKPVSVSEILSMVLFFCENPPSNHCDYGDTASVSTDNIIEVSHSNASRTGGWRWPSICVPRAAHKWFDHTTPPQRVKAFMANAKVPNQHFLRAHMTVAAAAWSVAKVELLKTRSLPICPCTLVMLVFFCMPIGRVCIMM